MQNEISSAVPIANKFINNMDFSSIAKTAKLNLKISEILHRAADEHLWSAKEGFPFKENQSEYSCIAILQVFVVEYQKIIKVWAVDYALCDYEYMTRYNPQYKQILNGLKNMGLKTVDEEGTSFINCSASEAQQRRYSWLKFAAMLAEEQEAKGEI